MIQVFYCTNTREYTNIRSCGGGETRVRPVPPTRANICIYTRKLYNKANLWGYTLTPTYLYCEFAFRVHFQCDLRTYD